MTKVLGGGVNGENTNRFRLDYEFDHDKYIGIIRISDGKDSMAIKLNKEGMIDFAKALSSILEWE